MFLEEDIAVKDPFHLSKTWLNEACESPEIREPNAFCLATVSSKLVDSNGSKINIIILSIIQSQSINTFRH